jgi:uncharacterized protein (TIGR00106 family)
MAVMDIAVVPVGTSSPSISEHVAKAVLVARESGLEATVTAMGTVVTGEVGELLALAGKMHKAVMSGKVVRCVTTIHIDDRTDKPMSAKSKVAAVEARL